MSRWCGLLAVLVLSTTWPLTAAPGDLPPIVLSGETRAAAGRLAEAQKRIAEKKWPQALEQLLAVLNATDVSLVPLDSGRSVQARRLAHALIARLPDEALRLYRGRVDPQATKWLEEALPRRDVRLLRRIVDEAFASTAAEKSLDLLGDLAFERGRFAEAEGWWTMLAPLTEVKGAGGEMTAELAYPRPQPERAIRAQAKQLLSRVFRDDLDGWAEAVNAFRKRHGTAAGALGGRMGKYADLLQTLAAERRKEPVPPRRGWMTFAGDTGRGRVVRIPQPDRFLERLGRHGRGGPTWRFSLENRKQLEDPGPPPRDAMKLVERGRSLAFQPVIAGNHVLVADARYVTAYDLRTGDSADWYDAAAVNGGVNPLLKLPATADLRYTLTVAEGCVFARLGVQDLRSDYRPDQSESLLVCLSLKPGPGGKRVRWTKKPRVNPRENAIYEGAPIVSGGLVYVAVTRFESDRTVTAVECYPAHPEDSTPPTLWRRDLCETRELQPREQRYRQHLLTVAGSNIVYCSHSGAIVALDTLTGRRTWGVRYHRAKRTKIETDALWRDLAPCVSVGERLFVAPADSDHLLCLNSATGRVLWERESMDVVHLLGVGQGRLIFATPRGLRAVGASDGSDTAGWSLPAAGGGLAPMGRGLLVGDLVLWPTARKPWGVFAVRQLDGQQTDDPSLLHRIPSGNLAYADGCLAVADRETLSVFLPPGRRLEERKQKIHDKLGSPAALLDLGRAEAENGLVTLALTHFSQAERAADSLSAFRRQKLLREVSLERQSMLVDQARRAAGARRWKDAARALMEASDPKRTPCARLWALVGAAQLWEEAGEPDRALAAWQAILSAQDLREEQVQRSDGNPGTAGTEAAAAVGRLRAAHGEGLYERVEMRAQKLWDSAQNNQRLDMAERLAREFPNAAVTRTALRFLAQLHEQAKQPGAAAHAYRRMLELGIEGPDQAMALVGLALTLEQQRCWKAARSIWQRLDRDHGMRKAGELSSLPAGAVANQPLHDFVAEHLRGPLFSEAVAAARTFPVRQRWNMVLSAEETVVPIASDEVLLTTSPLRHKGWACLVCRTTATGKPRWRSVLPFVPAWAACHADLILAGGEGGAAGIRLEDGQFVWKFSPPTPGPYPDSGLIAADWPRVVREPGTGEPLSSFSLPITEEGVGRLFFLQGKRRLIALEAETGKVLWQRWAPGAALQLPAPAGRYFPRYHAGPSSILIQTASGRRWLLDTATGRLIHDAPTSREPWPCAPLALKDRTICLVPDSRHVVLFDSMTGRELWTWTQPGFTTRSGEPPQVISDGDTLLVLAGTNLWYELLRLDRITGKPLWNRPRRLETPRLDVAGWTVDREAVYLVRDGALEARSLADGRHLWEQALPDGRENRWRLKRTGNHLLVWPLGDFAAQFQFRWLSLSVQWRGGPLPNQRGVFPLLCCDPQTGRVVQRLRFQTETLRLRQQITLAKVPRFSRVRRNKLTTLNPEWVPATNGTMLPRVRLRLLYSSESWSSVQIKGPTIVVSVAGQVWNMRGVEAK